MKIYFWILLLCMLHQVHGATCTMDHFKELRTYFKKSWDHWWQSSTCDTDLLDCLVNSTVRMCFHSFAQTPPYLHAEFDRTYDTSLTVVSIYTSQDCPHMEKTGVSEFVSDVYTWVRDIT